MCADKPLCLKPNVGCPTASPTAKPTTVNLCAQKSCPTSEICEVCDLATTGPVAVCLAPGKGCP